MRSATLSLVLLLSGCGGILSSSGPSSTAIMADDDSEAYEIIDLNAQNIAPYMRSREASLQANVALPSVPEVRLVAGDVLTVMIADTATEGAIFAPLAMGGTIFENVRVDSKGKISLPYVGHENVSGKTLFEVESLIKKKVRGITSDAQVRVSLTGDLSSSVLVAGAVKTPGRFSALQGPLTLLDAINLAGGPLLEPHLIRVIVRTGKKSYEFGYQELLAGENQVVPPGAEIIVERAKKRFVAMGAVGEPGLHDLPSNNPSLLEVLGSVRGLKDSQADASGVFIFRLTDARNTDADSTEPKAEVFRLNMKEPQAMFLARQFLVQPEDAIYVTNAAVHEWQKIISPIVQVMILGRTVNNGF